MTPDPDSGRRGFPGDWDVLADDEETAPSAAETSHPGPHPPPTLVLLATAWADGVAVLAVVTTALLVLNALGFGNTLAALPWAAGLAAAWWVFAAAVSVAIRQGTPGMLLAGVQFGGKVAPRRIAGVVAVAALSVLLLGLPGLLGARRGPLALASGRAVETLPVE
ncbi:MAG: hypothetical protein V2I67_04915 [Thermoanaerobaculales bacterium]|jgi:hypothetical protein|nr:hypothetical protein [Thermoanaerobaculales bacterium]